MPCDIHSTYRDNQKVLRPSRHLRAFALTVVSAQEVLANVFFSQGLIQRPRPASPPPPIATPASALLPKAADPLQHRRCARVSVAAATRELIL